MEIGVFEVFGQGNGGVGGVVSGDKEGRVGHHGPTLAVAPVKTLLCTLQL